MCLCICGPWISEFTPKEDTCLFNIFTVFHLGGGGGGGGSTPTCNAQHTYFSFFKTLRLILEVVPSYRAYHRTPNTVSINHVPTTYHRTTLTLILDVVPSYRAYHRTLNTVSINHVPMTYHRIPNTVSISTMHSHPCHVTF